MKRKELPRSVKIYVQQCGGVIIGGAAKPGAQIQNVTDIDVIIPFSHWKTAVVVAASFKPGFNSYGGLRYTEVGTEPMSLMTVDVWPGELSEFMGNGNVKYIWFPQHNYYWQRGDVIRPETGICG